MPNSDRLRNLELGNLVDSGGRVGRLVPSGRLYVPGKLWIQDDKLCWEYGNGRAVTPDRAMLNGFVNLWEMPAASILDFARNWGVLRADSKNPPSGRKSVS